MPWLAVPFEDRARKGELAGKFGVNGIPTLVVLDRDGNVMTTNGRTKVMEDPSCQNFPWNPNYQPYGTWCIFHSLQ